VSVNKVKKSLYKFLNDNLDTFVTYSSNESDLSDINGLYSNSDLTTPITNIVLTQGGVAFNTTSDLVGKTLLVNGYEDIIYSWNNVTNTVTLTTGFSFDISVDDEISILPKSLIYMNRAYDIPSKNARKCFFEMSSRFDLVVKVRDDSEKDTIDTLLQSIRSLIFGNYSKFTIYDDDLITKLGSGSISDKNYTEAPILDINNDIQSYLVSFIVGYYMSY